MKFNRVFATPALAASLSLMPLVAAAQPAASHSAKPVVSINGQVADEDTLTSFATMLELSEGFRAPNPEALLDEYILTQLYKEIPTTATVAEASVTTSASPYKSIVQRSLIKREYQKELSANVDVPRSDMEAWYATNKRQYEQPERVHAYHIFMETSDDEPSSAPAQVRQRLLDVKKAVDSGTSFSEAAEKYSEAASAKAGGEIGTITPRMPIGPLSKPMNVELEEVFFSLQPNKASDVVETSHGMHLLYITEKETTRTPTLDDLITSGILPGVLARDRVTSSIRGAIADVEQAQNGIVLPHGEETVSTNTVAFRLDGRDYTVGDLKNIYGPRFEAYLQQSQAEPEALRDFLKQAMDDEAFLLAAVKKGVDKNPELAGQLKQVAEREIARKRIDAIAEQESSVTQAEIQQRYEQLKDELRRPEAEGTVIAITPKTEGGAAEEARAREGAGKLAEETRKRLLTEDLDAVAKDLKANADYETTVTHIARHRLGETTETMGRIFDQLASGMNSAGERQGISKVMPMGTAFVVAKLNRYYSGEATPLEEVKDRIEAIIANEKRLSARHEMVKRLEQKAKIEYLEGAKAFSKGKAEADDATTGTQE